MNRIEKLDEQDLKSKISGKKAVPLSESCSSPSSFPASLRREHQ